MGKAAFTPAAQAYRFYNDDGSESTSTPYSGVAESTNITVVNSSNAQFHLRWRVQETGGAAGATTDDWGLDYQVNGTGGWTTVTASSSRVRAYTSSGLTADGATTNRATNGISDGTGSFVAGEQEETNGVIEDCQLTTSNFTEHVWALELVAADNSNGEVLHFRMTLNGGAPGMTNSATPQVTISKPVANTLDAQPGTFTLTGAATTNNVGRVTNAAAGSFTLTGADTGFTVSKLYTLNAEPATFTLSASAVTNTIGMNLNAAAASFTLTGADATLPVDRPLNAGAGSFTLSGADVSTVGAFNLTASPGSFTLTGAAATLPVGWTLNAEPGSFTLTGVAADLTAATGSTAYELDAAPGTFTLTGADAAFTYTAATTAVPESQGGAGGGAGPMSKRSKAAEQELKMKELLAAQNRHIMLMAVAAITGIME